jgi:hypothetical protein
MDGNRFDGLTRALSTRAGRRGVMSALAGGVVASVLGRQQAAAAKQKELGARCHGDAQCVSGFCDPVTRQCLALCNFPGSCTQPDACAPGCGCYCDPFVSNPDGSLRQFCLQDPTDAPTCSGLVLCLNGDEDCPRGTFCTASSFCGADSVCLPLCAA